MTCLSDDVRVPDVLGTAVGYRLFQISSADLLLRSLVFSGVSWERGENSARCLFSWDLVAGTPPHRACGCGLHAAFDLADVIDEYHYSRPGPLLRVVLPEEPVVTVSGVVEAYGRLLVGSRGFRAQCARVLGLSLEGFRGPLPYAARRHLRRVAEHYGVPLYSGRKQMVQAHPASSHLASDAEGWSKWG